MSSLRVHLNDDVLYLFAKRVIDDLKAAEVNGDTQKDVPR